MNLACGELMPPKTMPFQYLLHSSNRNNPFPLPESLLFISRLDLILVLSSPTSPKLNVQLQNHCLFPGQSFSPANHTKTYGEICKKIVIDCPSSIFLKSF